MTEKKPFNLNETLKQTAPAEQENISTEKENADLKQALEKEMKEIEDFEKEMESKPQDKRSREELLDEVVALNKMVQDSDEKIKRALAELENLRRRRDIDVQSAHKYSLEKFIKELLPVVDSFELAFVSAEENPTIEGIKLTYKMLLDALKKFSVEPLDPLHQPFNPEYHQAISQMETKEHPSHTVVQVMQKGYLLSGRVIRPALVIVEK